MSTQAAVPSASEMVDLVVAVAEGKVKPVRLGQARPHNDRNTHCKVRRHRKLICPCAASAPLLQSLRCPSREFARLQDLYEVVTDSFDELVLDPKVDVLVEGYTPRCDACKAFAPRMRMLATLAAKHWPGRARIACFNILDNDRPTEHMPEKWTPSLRLFLAEPGSADAASSARVAPAAEATTKRSVLFQYGKDSTGGKGSSSTAAPPEPGSSKVKVVIPTMPELLEFLQAQTGGRLAVSDAMRKEAVLLEEEALVLTAAYDQVLEYMELWKAHADTIASGGSAEERVASKELQRRIVAAHKFLVYEAAADSAEHALGSLQKIADYVAEQEVVERVEAAWADGSASSQDELKA